MYPKILELGPLTVHSYGLMMALGFLLAVHVWAWRLRALGHNPQHAYDLLVWVVLGGLLGARTAYILTDLEYYLSNPLKILMIHEGGLIFYGGFLGGVAATTLFARVRRIPLLVLLDVTVLPLPLSHALGRVGCVLNGCCYGRPWDSPLAIHYPSGSLAWWNHVHDAQLLPPEAPTSLPVHAVQLYEAGLNVLLFAALVHLCRRRTLKPGILCGSYLAVYALIRFAVEFFRGDAHIRVAGMSVAQMFSLILLAAGIAFAAWASRRPAPGQ